MSRQLPSIVTNPAGMLQKLADVGNWILSLRLAEIGQNEGFTGTDKDWADRFAAAFWKNNANGSTDSSPLPNISIAKGLPYCGLSVTMILRLAAKYANDLTDDERNYYLNSGNSSSQFPTRMDSKYVKKVNNPQLGTINVRGSKGHGHVNITVKNGQYSTINGNGTCKENVAGTQRDAPGGGICKGTPASLTDYYLLRIGGKFTERQVNIADNRVINSLPAESDSNPSNYPTDTNSNTNTASNEIDLTSIYSSVNEFLLTGKGMSDMVADKKDSNVTEVKDKEQSTKTIFNATHELDVITNPGATEG